MPTLNGHDPIDRFSLEFGWLSNFYKCVIYGKTTTVEHWFQALKTTDDEARHRILEAPGPGAAKRLGRKVQLRNDWEDVKLAIMEGLLREKFSLNNHVLMMKLLRTGNRELIEGNHWNDTYWGVCNGVGENHLGKLLMKIRSELQHGQ